MSMKTISLIFLVLVSFNSFAKEHRVNLLTSDAKGQTMNKEGVDGFLSQVAE